VRSAAVGIAAKAVRGPPALPEIFCPFRNFSTFRTSHFSLGSSTAIRVIWPGVAGQGNAGLAAEPPFSGGERVRRDHHRGAALAGAFGRDRGNPVADPDIEALAQAVDDEFAAEWGAKGVQPVALADDLTVLRRLSLGLLGTIPSFEEIRLARQVPEERQVDWFLERAFRDDRFSDYVAERLARSYVGTENGPFLVFRRRRFVDWLSDQVAANRPYDELVRDLIATTGTSTSLPASNFITRTVMPGNGPEEGAARGAIDPGVSGDSPRLRGVPR